MLIAPDDDYAIRRVVADRCTRFLQGKWPGALPSSCTPTAFRRRRLALQLLILDLLATGMSTRELSDAAIYPYLDLHGAKWRGANERRHVQRLRDEALYLAEDGYRSLLQGN